MTGRSADASIKGYMYQFIHSIKDILSNQKDFENTIEGIEDLDIKSFDEETLVQYKYHEFQHYKNSLVGKPIGLMFNHFINTIGEKYVYRLAIYLDDNLPQMNIDIMYKILSLKAAQDYIEDKNIKHCTDQEKIEKFIDVFNWEKTKSYDDVEKEIIVKLSQEFCISDEESEVIYLPNAIRKIIELGIKRQIDERKIKTKEFKQYLQDKKKSYDIAYMSRMYGEEKAANKIIKAFSNEGCKKNNTDFIVYIENTGRFQIDKMIIDIARKFFYKGNKKDFRPITFLVDESFELKKSISERISNSNDIMIFNDGYEDYFFCKEVFNREAITTGMPLRGKVNNVNYNFKIIKKDTYFKNKNDVIFRNGVLILIGKMDEKLLNEFDIRYHLGNLGNESILRIFGGCNG